MTDAQLGWNVLIRVNSRNLETRNLNTLAGYTTYARLERTMHAAAAERFVPARD